jgi:FtsZ-binding cell division protein ZapB
MLKIFEDKAHQAIDSIKKRSKKIEEMKEIEKKPDFSRKKLNSEMEVTSILFIIWILASL